MPITLRDNITFPFNGGRGIRTDQLDGLIQLDQVVDAIRDGAILLPDATTGELPDPSLAANQGKFSVSGNQFLHSIDRGAHDKIVAFKAYGPDRVVLSGEPALLTDEANFGGSFAVPPPIGNYSAGDYVWDQGSSKYGSRSFRAARPRG